MRSRAAILFAVLPILALIGALPFVNRLEPTVFGLPFVLFWILGWVLLTPLCLAATYYLRERR